MKNNNENKNFALRLDNRHYERIQIYAKQMKISVNTAINWAIDEFCSQIQSDNAPKIPKNKVINPYEKDLDSKDIVPITQEVYNVFVSRFMLNKKIKEITYLDFRKHFPKMNTKTINILMDYFSDWEINEIDKKAFISCRNAGNVTWKNFCMSTGRIEKEINNL